MPYVEVRPVIDTSVRGLCARPYEGHPKGCPNFGKVDRCPPKAPLFYQVFDEDGPFYAVYSSFAIGDHVRSMRVRHPNWSLRQCTCVLYWQGTARSRLRKEIAAWKRSRLRDEIVDASGIAWVVETTPEAMGCDVTATMRDVGLHLTWPPTEMAYQVAIAGQTSCTRVLESYAASKALPKACWAEHPGEPARWCSGCNTRRSYEMRHQARGGEF